MHDWVVAADGEAHSYNYGDAISKKSSLKSKAGTETVWQELLVEVIVQSPGGMQGTVRFLVFEPAHQLDWSLNRSMNFNCMEVSANSLSVNFEIFKQCERWFYQI